MAKCLPDDLLASIASSGAQGIACAMRDSGISGEDIGVLIITFSRGCDCSATLGNLTPAEIQRCINLLPQEIPSHDGPTN